MKIIETKNLTKYYGKVKGIENLNFEIEEGDFFGFIGPNGAGKSTTIRTLLSLIHPTGGSATIFGKDCQKEGTKIRQEIGYLPSEVFYYDGMTALNLLQYSASFYKKDCTKKIKSLAKELDLDLNKKIEDLSFGNKKKVGIIQTLLHEPKLIILDEPTGGLDPLIQQKFFDLLQAENKKGVTILFSSHILSEVQKMCNKVAIIKEGEIIRVDDVSSLTSNSYKKVQIETIKEIKLNELGLDGVTNFQTKNQLSSFVYKGEIKTLLEKVVILNPTNILIEDPSLEEIFMHYYKN